ncbi:hypothetical protein [Nocardia yamanashiensis]|uniref:hypothetical protein n=1 Tax=Nocardia yamanashiensis TaxID=209247 RepID=UPI000830DC2A|nr:hypothetical protein [Nocardia yamanashiensis]
MKKLGTFALATAAVAGVLTAGAGLASADAVKLEPVVAVGEPDPTSTGSSSITTEIAKLLPSLSAGKAAK